MQNTDQITIVSWRALSLKRLAYLDELKRTGRWKLHFGSEETFNQALQAASDDAERWKQLAYRSSSDQ